MSDSVDQMKARLRAAPLRIGISTRALFDLEEERKVFEEQGVHAYIELQYKRESELIPKGTAFELVDRLLRLNEPDSDPFVQIVVLSRNSPDLSLRAFKSIEHYGRHCQIKNGLADDRIGVAPFECSIASALPSSEGFSLKGG